MSELIEIGNFLILINEDGTLKVMTKLNNHILKVMPQTSNSVILSSEKR
jgi:hypothetical protein